MEPGVQAAPPRRGRQGVPLPARPTAGGRNVLLLPGPLGSVTLDGERSIGAQLHQAAGWRRAKETPPGFLLPTLNPGGEILTPPRAPATLDPRRLLELVGVVRPATGAAPAPAPTTWDGSAPCVPDKLGQFTIRYGNVSACFDAGWYIRYVTEGRMSSAADTLDTLWAPFRTTVATNGITGEQVLSVLGCWNIDLDRSQNSVTWDAFFEERGGPKAVLMFALELLTVYWPYASDPRPWSTKCDGLELFVGLAARGAPARNVVGDTCSVTIHVKSIDDRFEESETNCRQGETDRRCADGMGSCTIDPKFDDWEPFEVDNSFSRYFQWKEGLGTPYYDGPGTSCGSGAGSPSRFDIQLHASEFAFEGYLVDYLMYWARAAMDYSVETGSYPHYVTAIFWARHALYICAKRARHLVHEFGHIWRGVGGHCTQDCCFDVAAEAWLCAASAALALHYHGGNPDSSVGPVLIGGRMGCGATGEFYYSLCGIRHPGQVGEGSEYWASTCWSA